MTAPDLIGTYAYYDVAAEWKSTTLLKKIPAITSHG